MIGLHGRGSAFFAIQGLNFNETFIDEKDLIGLTVTEELDKLTMGTIKLLDRNHIYSSLLTRGAQLAISWGYALLGDIGNVLMIGDDITAVRERRGLRVMVMSPGGSGKGGSSEYSCNFWAIGLRGSQRHEVYESMKREDVIRQVMQRIGVVTPEINFDTQTITFTSEVVERQDETDFQFLARKAREWRAYLMMGHDPAGNPVGAFVDVDKIATSRIVQSMTGGIGNEFTLNYNTGDLSNCLEYDWQCSDGENGVGAGTQIVMVNGQPTIIRYTVEGETVRTWNLNTDRLEAEYAKRDYMGQASLTAQIWDADQFKEVERYFDPVDQTTAPNGHGYTLTAKVLGNPVMVPPSIVRFGKGFPNLFTSVDMTPRFFLRRNEHSIGRDGYTCSLEIVDVPTLMETGTQISIPAAIPTEPSAQNTSAVPKTQTPTILLPIKPM
jgi:hypothetical protein